MHKFILLLTVVFLSGSTLFASSNRPIYTVKDCNVHRSEGPNQDKCYQSSYHQQRDGNIVREDRRCNESKRNDNRR